MRLMALAMPTTQHTVMNVERSGLREKIGEERHPEEDGAHAGEASAPMPARTRPAVLAGRRHAAAVDLAELVEPADGASPPSPPRRCRWAR